MELVASFPVDLLAAADPLAREPAPLLRPAGAESEAGPVAVPFAVFLELLGTSVPGGEALPGGGNGLPPATIALPANAPATAIAAPVAGANTSAPAPAATLSNIVFERFRLPALGVGAPLASATPEAVTGETAAATATPQGEVAATLPPPDLPADAPESAATVDTAQRAELKFAAQPVPASVAAAASPGELTAALPRVPAPLEARRVAASSSSQLRTTELRVEPMAAGAVRYVFAPSAPAPTAEIPANTVQTVLRDGGAPSLPVSPGPGDSLASVASATPDGQPTWLLPAASQTMTAASTTATAAQPGAPGAGVDTRSPNWHEAFAGRLQWLVDTQVGEARIKLNPPELGAVDVKISLVEDKTYVQLTAGSSMARDELAQSLPRLRELLTASGLELGGASVHAGHDGRGGYEGAASGTLRSGELPLPGEDAQAAPARAPVVAGRIDLFA